MARIKDSPEERSLFGRWARWAAAPYCEFKDDRARLLALVARDLRKVIIAVVLAVTGVSLPWRAWIALLVG
ncbi:hypothetical protein FOB72_11170 [Cupriavidus pauculus]|uniref:Uncharacterized protein n=1 Tax=Cupriavidus pauculus TaxID=82633 RepID=A0A5P2H3G0_9BURK|nr:hypothetical protein [Cupriavidus pauculus]QET02541.1 hypothetical protein FOB72_11170 [Cupriavidus pauculus]